MELPRQSKSEDRRHRRHWSSLSKVKWFVKGHRSQTTFSQRIYNCYLWFHDYENNSSQYIKRFETVLNHPRDALLIFKGARSLLNTLQGSSRQDSREAVCPSMGCFKPHVIFAPGFTLRPCSISSARTCYTEINSNKMMCFNMLQNAANYATMHNWSRTKLFKDNFLTTNNWGRVLSFEELIIPPFIIATTQIMGHSRFNYNMFLFSSTYYWEAGGWNSLHIYLKE